MSRSRQAPVVVLRPIEGKVPPNDLDAEIRALASVFEEPSVLDAIASIAPPVAWYSEPNKNVLQAMMAIQESGDDPTLASVRAHLSDHGKLERVGGNAYLEQIVTSVPYVLEPEREADRIADKAKLRRTIETCYEFSARAFTEEGITGQGLIDELETRVFALAENRTSLGFRTARQVTADVCREILKANEEDPPCFTTGLVKLDAMLGGLYPGDLTVVAGRPGMGKTSLALHLASVPAMPKNGGYATGIIEVEMPARQLMHRIAGSVGRVAYRKLRRPRTLLPAEIRLITAALGTVSEWPIEICDDSEITAGAIRASARRLQSKHRKEGRDLSVVVVDYLQLLATDSAEGKTREREVAEVTRAMKLMAKSLGVHVILAAQLNREVEGTKSKRPALKDLRESGAIEQDADNVLLLYREDYYRSKEQQWNNICEINVAKQRNGPTGTVEVRFDAACSRFDNLESDEPVDNPPNYQDPDA